MRSISALILLIALCASASAAAVSHSHRRHAVVRVKQSAVANTVPGFAYATPARPIPYHAAPLDHQPGPHDNRYPDWGM